MRPIALFLAFLLLAMSNAYGYLDPGSGSAILQGIIGGLAAIAITLKLYWHRLLRFLGVRKPSAGTESVVPGESGKSEN